VEYYLKNLETVEYCLKNLEMVGRWNIIYNKTWKQWNNILKTWWVGGISSLKPGESVE